MKRLRPTVAAVQRRPFSSSCAKAATPLGLRPHTIRVPKVAEYGNLGLWDATPLGLPWRRCLIRFRYAVPKERTMLLDHGNIPALTRGAGWRCASSVRPPSGTSRLPRSSESRGRSTLHL